MIRLPYWEQLIFRLLYVAQRPIHGLDVTEMPKIEIYDRKEPFPQQGYYYREGTMRFGIDPTSPSALDNAFAIASHEFGHHIQALAGTWPVFGRGRDLPTVYVREQARLKELLPEWEHHPVEIEAEETRRILQPRLAAAQTMIVPSRPVAFEELSPEERARQALQAQAEAIAAAGKGRVVTEWETYRALETRAKNPLLDPTVVRSDIRAALKEGTILQEQADTLLDLVSERERLRKEEERRREEEWWREEELRREERRPREEELRREEEERKRKAETARWQEENQAKNYRLLTRRLEDPYISSQMLQMTRAEIQERLKFGGLTDVQAQLLLSTLAFREREEREKREREEREFREHLRKLREWAEREKREAEAARRTEAEKLEIELRGAGYGKLRGAARTSTPATFAVVENAIIRGVGEETITVAQQGELLAILDAKRFG